MREILRQAGLEQVQVGVVLEQLVPQRIAALGAQRLGEAIEEIGRAHV